MLKNILGNQSSTNEAQSTIYTILEPAPDYAEIFLDQDLVKLLFKLYELVKDNTEIAHVLMQSIIQLSSLDGKILTEHETHTGSFSTRVKFLETYLESFLALYSRFSSKCNRTKQIVHEIFICHCFKGSNSRNGSLQFSFTNSESNVTVEHSHL